jgi:DNA (cytosine-5)-methyltransferase 1
VNAFVSIIRRLKPTTFLFENVRGLVTARDGNGTPGGVIKSLFSRLQGCGYSCRTGLLNAADYGACQRRVRCFIIGVRHGEAPQLPEPTHYDPIVEYGHNIRTPWVTLRQFLEANADPDETNWVLPTPELAKQLKTVPDGSGLKSTGKAEATRPGGHWGYRQGTFISDLDKPARTVTGSASQDFIRWNGILRRLTLLEIRRLQGFPDDWILEGSRTQQFKQIGNAVPTVFGEALGRILGVHLERGIAGDPVKLRLPAEYEESIRYTKRDHARNKDSRSIHKVFQQGWQEHARSIT